jgi:pimeloyl-ACP methyl ester carboxylesterase
MIVGGRIHVAPPRPGLSNSTVALWTRAVCDRGGRVAYRAALGHLERVEKLAVLDVLPIDAVWDRANAEMTLAFWPWSLLSHPEPLPSACSPPRPTRSLTKPRAAETIDLEHDAADRQAGRRISCPVLALWRLRVTSATPRACGSHRSPTVSGARQRRRRLG